jgi:HlyD family secretion protein
MVAGVVVVAVAAVIVVRRLQPDATVAVVKPRTEDLRAYVEEQAVTELPRDYLVSMPIDGWLEPIALREGDTVAAKKVVAKLDTEDLSDRVRQIKKRIAAFNTRIRKSKDNRLEDGVLVEAQAMVKAVGEVVKAGEKQVEAAKAVADYAALELKRMAEAAESGAATEIELRKAEMDARRAAAEHSSDAFQLAAVKAIDAISHVWPTFVTDYRDLKSYDREEYQQQIQQAEAELAIAERNLARAKIISPIDGVVLERHRTRRQFLPAGTPLLRLGRLEDMEIIAEVLTERATRISKDDPVEIYGEAIPDGPVRGEVLQVYPAGFEKVSSLGVEQQRVKVAVKLLERPPRLGVGFRVHVRIFHDKASGTLTIPRTALFRGPDGGWQVFVVRDGKVALRNVKLGLMTDDRAQVTAGLDARDDVIAKPGGDISSGLRVEVSEGGG